MSAVAAKLTVEDFHAVTEEGDRKQLVDGVIVVNQPKLLHGLLQARIAAALCSWVADGEDRGLATAPTEVVMDEYNVFGPDVLWIAEHHRPADLNSYPDRAPELCVEVRSESTWCYDIGAKKSAYERGGLPELWLVDSEAETILVYRRGTAESPTFDVALELTRDDILTSPQLPGFGLSLESLFDL